MLAALQRRVYLRSFISQAQNSVKIFTEYLSILGKHMGQISDQSQLPRECFYELLALVKALYFAQLLEVCAIIVFRRESFQCNYT